MQRAVVAVRLENGDGAVVDGGVVDGQRAERVDRDVGRCSLLDAPVSSMPMVRRRVSRRAAGVCSTSMFSVLVTVSLWCRCALPGAGDVDDAVIVENAVGEHPVADQVERAVIVAAVLENGDGALVDAGVVERQRAERVDRNLAGVVVDGAVQIDGQRAAGQHLDVLGVGDVLVVERIARRATSMMPSLLRCRRCESPRRR